MTLFDREVPVPAPPPRRLVRWCGRPCFRRERASRAEGMLISCVPRERANSSRVSHSRPSRNIQDVSDKPQRPKQVAVVIAHDLVRAGVHSVLADSSDFEVGMASAGVDYMPMRAYAPDLVVIDAEPPGSTSGRLVTALSQLVPSAAILAVTERSIVQELHVRGVKHVVSVWAPKVVLINTARVAAAVHAPTQEALAPLNLPSDSLTPREHEVLVLLANAFANKVIAEMLGISEGTVKRHTNNIYRKLHASSRVHAVLEARRFGYVA